MSLLLIIVLLLLIFGGGSFYYGRSAGWGPGVYGGSGLGFILIIILVIFVAQGRF